jgi:acetyl-CoA carboxylase biotin carboxyl carrier protein
MTRVSLSKPKLLSKLKNMDFKQIQELIKMINKSNIGELTIEQKDFRVTIKQKEEHVTQVVSAPVQSAPAYSAAPAAPVAPSAPSGSSSTEKPKTAEAPASNLITIKSPMIGTFYRKASPDKPNLVEVGAEVTPGKVVCIIEAMKLFNEIESEVKGKIVKVLVEDASPVEYDQPLFLVEPA